MTALNRDTTVEEALAAVRAALEGAGIDEAPVEAEWILAHVLGVRRLEVFLQGKRPLTTDERQEVDEIVRRRQGREPLAYILGSVDFRGHLIKVTGDVLIPRPETEVLVEEALRILEGPGRPPLVIEPRTGSGCIGVAIAAELEGARLVALDISQSALAVARENARASGVEDRVLFARGDLLLPIRGTPAPDMIISNPPYVPHGEIPALSPEIRDFEPIRALDGGPDGLDCIRRLITEAAALLRPDGVLLLEIGDTQGEEVMGLARATGFYEEIRIKKDLSGMERIFFARKKNTP